MDAYWLQKLKENSKNYEPSKWDGMSLKQRKQAVKNTINLLREIAYQNKLYIRFGGEVLEFNSMPMRHSHVRIGLEQKMDIDCAGFFDANQNMIKINNWLLLSEHGFEVFENVLHEFTHKLEWELSKRREEYQLGTKHRFCLDVLRCNSNKCYALAAFGIDCGQRLYIDGDAMTQSPILNRKKEVLYLLMSSERLAFSMSQSMSKQLFDNYSPNKYINEFHEFRAIYHCMHFSNEQIAKIVDHAQEYIVHGRSLQNAYEAVVAYDIATTVALQNATITSNEYVELQKDEVKVKILNSLGYDIPWTKGDQKNIEDEGLICDLEYLNQLSPEQQLSDPELIFQVARVEMSRVLDVIKDIDALKDWYYSKDNTVPSSVHEDLGVYLGCDFSPKMRELKMSERGMIVEKKENDNVGVWPYEKEILQEIDFSNSGGEKFCHDEDFDIVFGGLD